MRDAYDDADTWTPLADASSGYAAGTARALADAEARQEAAERRRDRRDERDLMAATLRAQYAAQDVRRA